MSKQHFIVPGSLEINDLLIAGIHTGASEYAFENIRYVQIKTADIKDKTQSLLQILSDVYDNSTGCLVKRDFRMN